MLRKTRLTIRERERLCHHGGILLRPGIELECNSLPLRLLHFAEFGSRALRHQGSIAERWRPHSNIYMGLSLLFH